MITRQIEDHNFLESGLEDAFGNLEPLTKEEYEYYMSLPDKDEPAAK
jgi:hypothetical protein